MLSPVCELSESEPEPMPGPGGGAQPIGFPEMGSRPLSSLARYSRFFFWPAEDAATDGNGPRQATFRPLARSGPSSLAKAAQRLQYLHGPTTRRSCPSCCTWWSASRSCAPTARLWAAARRPLVLGLAGLLERLLPSGGAASGGRPHC